MLNVLKRSQKGFTLTELIVVIAILGVLAAVVTPSVLGYITDARDSADKMNASTLDSTVKRLVAKGTLNLNSAENGGYDNISSTESKAAITAIIMNEINPIPAVNDTTKHFVLKRSMSNGKCTSVGVTFGTAVQGADSVWLEGTATAQ